MKVSPSGLDLKGLDLNKSENKKSTLDSGSPNKSLAGDLSHSAKINVSQDARDINRIKEIASASPDVDADKVAKFKELINSGQYQINAAGIADKMVDEELMIGKLEN